MGICKFLLRPTDSSLRVFSLVQLYTAIYLGGDIFDTGTEGHPLAGVSPDRLQSAVKQCFQSLRLRFATDSMKVHYYSAIPLAIAARLQLPPDHLGEWLTQAVCSTAQQDGVGGGDRYAVSLHVEIRITERGYLDWAFDTAALKVWLPHAIKTVKYLLLPQMQLSVDQQQADWIWQAQYTYANCCRYLVAAGEAASRVSDFADPGEYATLVELIALIDELNDLSLPLQQDFLPASVTTLCQLFERLDKSEICHSIGQVSQVRLDLVMLIKSLIHQLVTDCAGLKLVEDL